ncbi:MAG: hypothetical protein U0768_18305 [Anaerolineae bacterium]
MRARFGEMAAAAGASAPNILAGQLLMLMDGAFMSVRVFGADSPRGVARGAAALIQAQLAPADAEASLR